MVKHPWTETVQLGPYQYRSDTVEFASHLKRKCLPYPESKDNPSFYLPIDFDGPHPKAVTVPVYPEEGDDVIGLGRGGQIWFGRIISSDTENRKSNLKWFMETRSGIYTLSSQEDVVAILGFAHIRRAMGGYRIDN